MDSDDYGMYEIRNVRQDGSELHLRWFTCLECDLYIWQNEESEIIRFQFYFNKQTDEQMIEWKEAAGFWTGRVDEGDSGVPFKSSPLLQETSDLDYEEALRQFEKYGNEIDPGVNKFVRDRIQEKILQISSL